MNARKRLVLFVALIATTLIGCGGADPKREEADNGHVRLVNASSLPSLDFYEAETRLGAGVVDSAASNYNQLKPNGYLLRVKEAGSNSTLVMGGFTVTANRWNTLVAYTTDGAVKLAYLDESEPEPSAGIAKLRVFNASTEAGSLDVFVTSASQNLTGTLATVPGTLPEEFSTYREIGEGTYRIRVTGANAPNDVRLDMPSVTLSNRQVTTLVITSTSSGVLVNGITLEQRGAATARKNTSSRLRLVAGTLPTASTVAATVNGVALQFASPHVGAYALVPSGALTLDLLVNGTPATVAPLTATAGNDLTLMVLGTAAAPLVRLLHDDNRPPGTALAKLRLVNGLNNLASPLTLTLDSTVAADGVALGEASEPTVWGPLTYQFEVTAPGIITPIVAANDRTLIGNKVYTLFVLGDSTTGAPTVVLNASR